MIKKSLMSSTKDALEENSSENSKKESQLVSNQKVVAKSLSNNKVVKTIEENFHSQFLQSSFKEKSNFENLTSLTRAWFDFQSLNQRYNDKELVKKFIPADSYKKDLFEIFNSSRCLALGFKEYVGCKKNIKKIKSSLANLLNLKNSNKEQLLYKTLIDFLCNNKFNKSNSLREDFPTINKKKLETLQLLLGDQNSYLKKVVELIKEMRILEDRQKEEASNSKSKENGEDLKKSKQKIEKKKQKISFSEFLDSKKKSKSETKQDYNDHFGDKSDTFSEYKVFTKEYDSSLNANKLAGKNELRELRKKFEKECLDNTRLINKLAKKLERLLSSLNYNSWKFDQEEGFFDNSRFANFIANPNNSLIFKFEKESIDKNTIVSLLLDNSGSMRGKPIITSAITAEIITKVLEKCRVNVELLGFTTKEWKGGQSKKKWEQSGKVKSPGRLNDILHIIYKDADTRWANCKNNLGLVLKEGLLKENIDGEALTWANNRLKNRPEKKKILIVISDGAPVDDSTLSANSPEILDDHLKVVVSGIEKNKHIKLLAIGIGHDVSKYYKNAFVIEDAKNLGDVIIDNLTLMLGEKKY